MSKNNLYGWVFTFNPHTNQWLATTRDNYLQLFDNQKSADILRSSSIKTLEEIIIKTNGNADKIKNLIK